MLTSDKKNLGQIQPYNREAEEVLTLLQTSEQGLSQQQVEGHLRRYGDNVLKTSKPSLLKRLLEPFTSLFVSVLLVAVAISLINDEKADAVIIAVVLVANAFIYYFQQISSARALNDLKRYDQSYIKVIRGGQTIDIPSEKLVPGDVIHLNEGIKVPADARLVKCDNFHVDESVLTGESLPIHKKNVPLQGEKQLFDQSNMVFKGTLVTAGSALAVITATGNFTELGKIGMLVSSDGFERSPIERKIDILTRKIVVVVGVVGAAVFLLAAARGTELSEALRFSLSLVVSLVPEGLPVAMTVVLLLCAKRMAKTRALVRKISAIETLGAVTLIAVDKTGTLTKNKLSVAGSYTAGDKDELARVVAASLNFNENNGSDILDEVLHDSFDKKGLSGWKKIKDFPFHQHLRSSAVVWKKPNGQVTLFVKGSPEHLLNVSKNVADGIGEALDSFSKKGYRVIGFAHKDLTGPADKMNEELLKNLTFDGIVGLADEVRPGIDRTLSLARAAGIKVIMLTGDHIETAREIGRHIGLVKNDSQVADGQLLETMSADEIRQRLSINTVFARVLPKYKFNFLKAVKNQEITAMTGDGVNDVPALVEADIGMSMGGGTDAAKDASEIILLDNSFNTILKAIRLGRSVIANTRKMLFYVISTSIGEAATMIGALLWELPLPVTAAQILWINLVTDSFSILPLGLGKPEPRQMEQGPNDPKAPLLNRVYISRILVVGLAMAIVTLLIFDHLLPKGYIYAQSGAFMALVVAQWANSLNANFEIHSWTRNFTRPNWYLWGGLALAIFFQILVFAGPFSGFFGLVGLSLGDLALVTILPIITVLLLGDAHKLATRKS